MTYYNKPFSLVLFIGIIRAVIRMTATFSFIFLTFIFYIPLNALLSGAAQVRNRASVQRFITGTILWIIGGRIVRTGPKPQGHVFFVANHLGLADVFTVMSETGARMVAKESLRRIPLIGFYMEKLGIIFIKRDSLSDMNRVVREMTEAYKQGHPVAFFPEGTTSNGQGIRELLGALFLPAIECKAPVHYGTITFHVPSPHWPMASVSVCQLGSENFISHVFKICVLPKFEVHIKYGETPVPPAKRKALVRDVEQRMVSQFSPMLQLPEDEFEQITHAVKKESQAMKSRPFIQSNYSSSQGELG